MHVAVQLIAHYDIVCTYIYMYMQLLHAWLHDLQLFKVIINIASKLMIHWASHAASDVHF